MIQVTKKVIYRLLVSTNNSVNQLAKQGGHYPPKINLDKNQSLTSMKLQFNKLNSFISMPHYSYLSKNKQNN